MKYLILLTLIFTTTAFAVDKDDCRKCGQRIITCRDLDMQRPELASDFTAIEDTLDRLVQFDRRYYGVEAKGTVPLVIKLSGCDSKSMADATLELSAQYGSFSTSKTKPDVSGTARVLYKAPDKGVDDRLKVVHRYTASDSTSVEISDKCIVRVLKPTDSIYADITLCLFDREVHVNGDGQKVADNINDCIYSTTLECSVGPDVIRMLRSLRRPLTPAEKKLPLTVLSGSSLIDVYSPDYTSRYTRRHPLHISQHETREGYERVKGEKKWVKIYEKVCDGTSKDDGLQVTVEKLRNSGATENAPDNSYVLLLSGVGLDASEGNGKVMSWDDNKGELVLYSSAPRLLNPGKTAFSDQEYGENEKTEPIIIRATGTDDQKPKEVEADPFDDSVGDPLASLLPPTGFEDYLLGPVGDITLFLEGTSFYNEDYNGGRRSVWRNAQVNLTLYPKGTKSIKSEDNNQIEEKDMFDEPNPEAEKLRKRVLDKLRKYLQEHPESMFGPNDPLAPLVPEK